MARLRRWRRRSRHDLYGRQRKRCLGVVEEVGARLFREPVHGSTLAAMTETPDDLLEPDDDSEEATADEEDEQGLSAEESLGLLPPD